MYNYYHTQKAAEAHRYDLMCEAEQQRLVAELPKHRNFIAAKLDALFTMLGSSMQRFGRTAMKTAPTTAPLSLGSPHH